MDKKYLYWGGGFLLVVIIVWYVMTYQKKTTSDNPSQAGANTLSAKEKSEISKAKANASEFVKRWNSKTLDFDVEKTKTNEFNVYRFQSLLDANNGDTEKAAKGYWIVVYSGIPQESWTKVMSELSVTPY